jgi:hypothetical protein
VKVGVIDSGFYINNPILKDHIVDMFPQKLFSGEQFFSHGTLVAKALLAVAPDVSLVLLHDDDDLDYPARAALEAQAIDHAVQQGVKVITSSNQAWANIPELQAAIDRAIAVGVVFVWSDYTGLNEAVIRPGYFRSSAWEVGTFTFFLDEDRPAESEGGYSFSAPQIAAIAALILQNEPGLTPLQVKQRIIETATVLLPTGVSIADAAAAVENRPSGRKLEARSIPAGAGHVRLTYQTDADQPTVLEIEESHQHWPIASLPRQDILLYRALPALTGPYPATFRLIAYQDRMQVLTIEWSGKEWATGDYPARLTLLPDSEWKPFYLIGLGIREVPALHVEVLSDRVRLSWSSAEGARLTRKDPDQVATQPSSFCLLNFEIETMQMPDLIEPIY